MFPDSRLMVLLHVQGTFRSNCTSGSKPYSSHSLYCGWSANNIIRSIKFNFPLSKQFKEPCLQTLLTQEDTEQTKALSTQMVFDVTD